VYKTPPCYHAFSKAFTVADLTVGDHLAADAFVEYDSILRKVRWAAVNDRLPYNSDPTRNAPCTVLPHQVGTVADRRCHNVRVMSVLPPQSAQLGALLADPLHSDVAPPELPVTRADWAVPAGAVVPEPGGVPPSAQEATSAAAYRARKRRQAEMARAELAGSASGAPEPHSAAHGGGGASSGADRPAG